MSRKEIPDNVVQEMVESWKIIQNFKSDENGFAGICQMKLRLSNKDPTDLKGHLGMTKVQILATSKDGSFIVYVEGKPDPRWIQFSSSKYGFQSPPFELTSKSWRKTFYGTERQVEKMLSRIEKSGLRFKVVSAGDAQFTPDSLLMSLTESQRKTLIEAYNNGYFDFPRKIGSKKLARLLGISKSTVSEHLRKAEKTMLSQILV